MVRHPNEREEGLLALVRRGRLYCSVHNFVIDKKTFFRKHCYMGNGEAGCQHCLKLSRKDRRKYNLRKA